MESFRLIFLRVMSHNLWTITYGSFVIIYSFKILIEKDFSKGTTSSWRKIKISRPMLPLIVVIAEDSLETKTLRQ